MKKTICHTGFTERVHLMCKLGSKHVAQKKKNGHKSPNNSHNYHDEIELYQGLKNEPW